MCPGRQQLQANLNMFKHAVAIVNTNIQLHALIPVPESGDEFPSRGLGGAPGSDVTFQLGGSTLLGNCRELQLAVPRLLVGAPLLRA